MNKPVTVLSVLMCCKIVFEAHPRHEFLHPVILPTLTYLFDLVLSTWFTVLGRQLEELRSKEHLL